MDRTNEGAPAPSYIPPATAPTQTLQVTADNVVELGVLFGVAADFLEREVQELRRDLTLPVPWLDDPVSRWMQDRFNEYFVDGENSLATVLERAYRQHQENFEALTRAAEQYGLADELSAAVVQDVQVLSLQPPS